MAIPKQRALAYLEHEWGTYVERFNRLSKEEQKKRLDEAGYASFRDLLAHVLAWWEEGMDILRAITEERPFERKKYDFDAFNAAAVAKYKPWDEDKFLAHFEATRRQMAADLTSMEEAVFEKRRVQAWLDGMLVHHAREHLLALSRFLAVDMLENNWATYIEDFNCLESAAQKEFLAKQSVDSLHDLLAHIIGWWEESARIITGILNSPGFAWQDPDTDAFNLELTRKFSTWSDEDLVKHYESLRLALIDMVERLPEDAFLNKAIEGWLASDIVKHYDDHPIPHR